MAAGRHPADARRPNVELCLPERRQVAPKHPADRVATPEKLLPPAETTPRAYEAQDEASGKRRCHCNWKRFKLTKDEARWIVQCSAAAGSAATLLVFVPHVGPYFRAAAAIGPVAAVITTDTTAGASLRRSFFIASCGAIGAFLAFGLFIVATRNPDGSSRGELLTGTLLTLAGTLVICLFSVLRSFGSNYNFAAFFGISSSLTVMYGAYSGALGGQQWEFAWKRCVCVIVGITMTVIASQTLLPLRARPHAGKSMAQILQTLAEVLEPLGESLESNAVATGKPTAAAQFTAKSKPVSLSGPMDSQNNSRRVSRLDYTVSPSQSRQHWKDGGLYTSNSTSGEKAVPGPSSICVRRETNAATVDYDDMNRSHLARSRSAGKRTHIGPVLKRMLSGTVLLHGNYAIERLPSRSHIGSRHSHNHHSPHTHHHHRMHHHHQHNPHSRNGHYSHPSRFLETPAVQEQQQSNLRYLDSIHRSGRNSAAGETEDKIYHVGLLGKELLSDNAPEIRKQPLFASAPNLVAALSEADCESRHSSQHLSSSRQRNDHHKRRACSSRGDLRGDTAGHVGPSLVQIMEQMTSNGGAGDCLSTSGTMRRQQARSSRWQRRFLYRVRRRMSCSQQNIKRAGSCRSKITLEGSNDTLQEHAGFEKRQKICKKLLDNVQLCQGLLKKQKSLIDAASQEISLHYPYFFPAKKYRAIVNEVQNLYYHVASLVYAYNVFISSSLLSKSTVEEGGNAENADPRNEESPGVAISSRGQFGSRPVNIMTAPSVHSEVEHVLATRHQQHKLFEEATLDTRRLCQFLASQHSNYYSAAYSRCPSCNKRLPHRLLFNEAGEALLTVCPSCNGNLSTIIARTQQSTNDLLHSPPLRSSPSEIDRPGASGKLFPSVYSGSSFCSDSGCNYSQVDLPVFCFSLEQEEAILIARLATYFAAVLRSCAEMLQNHPSSEAVAVATERSRVQLCTINSSLQELNIRRSKQRAKFAEVVFATLESDVTKKWQPNKPLDWEAAIGISSAQYLALSPVERTRFWEEYWIARDRASASQVRLETLKEVTVRMLAAIETYIAAHTLGSQTLSTSTSNP